MVQSASSLAHRGPAAPAAPAPVAEVCDDLLELFRSVTDGRPGPRARWATHGITDPYHAAADIPVRDGTVSGQAGRVWRVRDRLSEEDILEIIQEFSAGGPKHALADQFGISLSSVKLLLRQRGVKRDKLS